MSVLDISALPVKPDGDDWGFVFAGRNTVTSLRGAPGMPWRISEVSAQWDIDLTSAVPVGYWQNKGVWAFSVPESSVNLAEQLSGNLYSLLGRVDDGLFHAHGRAYQLLHWIETHRRCGRCGAATLLVEDGRAVSCEACALRVYPRVSPCVIVLVSKGDKMLLAAAAGFQKRFYSTLAGFMEAGETCEAAVIREVREEVGIEVGKVRYFASQPWPFPASIMLGFRAKGTSTEINCADEELVEARWFTRQEVRSMSKNNDMLPPANYSISRWLIDSWLREE